MGRLTLSILAAIVRCELVSAATCVPFECTEISTAASASSTSSVSYVHSGNGHLYLGMFGEFVEPCNAVFWRYLGVCSSYGGVARVVIIQDGGPSVNSVCFKRKVTTFLSLWRPGRTPKCCVGLFASYGSLVINRNESISDVSADILITQIKTLSTNEERTKRGAEEPGFLLHNIILTIL